MSRQKTRMVNCRTCGKLVHRREGTYHHPCHECKKSRKGYLRPSRDQR